MVKVSEYLRIAPKNRVSPAWKLRWGVLMCLFGLGLGLVTISCNVTTECRKANFLVHSCLAALLGNSWPVQYFLIHLRQSRSESQRRQARSQSATCSCTKAMLEALRTFNAGSLKIMAQADSGDRGWRCGTPLYPRTEYVYWSFLTLCLQNTSTYNI